MSADTKALAWLFGSVAGAIVLSGLGTYLNLLWIRWAVAQ